MHIVIIGAGIVGASTAFHLSSAGAQVTIIDAGLDGRATAAGAGIICPWVSGVDDPVFYRLYAAGGDYYPKLIAALGQVGQTGTGYRRSGALLVGETAQDLDWLEQTARQRAEPAMGEIRRLTAQQAQTRFPPLRRDLGGIFIQGGGRVDGRCLASALLAAAASQGTSIIQGHATLAAQATRIIGVDVAGHRIHADRVILTAGAWTDPILRPLGVTAPVQPQRGQIVHLHLDGVRTEDWPVILPPGSHYLVPFDSGRIVVGATRESGTGFDYRITAAGQAEVLNQALAIAPGLATATLIETRIGFRPIGPALRPLFGWMPGIEGLAIGTGLGAAGLTIGPFAGRLLAELATGQTPSLDLTPFHPGRHTDTQARQPAPLR